MESGKIFGAYGALPKDVWEMVVSKMDDLTLSLMLSVHPRLFGPLMRKRFDRRPKCIPTEWIKPNMQSNDVTELKIEPLKHIFLACSHLDEQEECFNGLCNTKHTPLGSFSIPMHFDAAALLLHEHTSSTVEKEEYKQLLKMLVSNPSVLYTILYGGAYLSQVWFVVLSQMISQRGLASVYEMLEYFVRRTRASSRNPESKIEACFGHLLNHFCEKFLRDSVLPLLLDISKEQTPTSLKNLLESLASSMEHLPPIACDFVQRVNLPTDSSMLKESSEKHETKYPFGRVRWNLAATPEPVVASAVSVSLGTILARAICTAACSLEFPSAAESRVRSLLEPLYLGSGSPDATNTLAASITERICRREIGETRTQLCTCTEQRNLTQEDRTRCAMEVRAVLRSLLLQHFYSIVAVLSKQELQLLAKGDLYLVTDFLHVKVIGRASAESRYRYIRTIRHPMVEELHMNSSDASNSLGCCVTKIRNDIYLDRCAHAEGIVSLELAQSHSVTTLPICIDDQHVLWTTWWRDRPTRGKELALYAHQIHSSGASGTPRVTDDILGSFSHGPVSSTDILLFRVRITGGLVVLVRRLGKLYVERYLCD